MVLPSESLQLSKQPEEEVTDSACRSIIDNVLNVEPFDRASLTPSASAADRVAYAGASTVSELPFSSVTFLDDLATYTTPALLSTMIAIVTPTPEAETTTSGAEPVPTAGAVGRNVGGALAMGAIAGVAAIMI
jgi:hypothetical protein